MAVEVAVRVAGVEVLARSVVSPLCVARVAWGSLFDVFSCSKNAGFNLSIETSC